MFAWSTLIEIQLICVEYFHIYMNLSVIENSAFIYLLNRNEMQLKFKSPQTFPTCLFRESPHAKLRHRCCTRFLLNNIVAMLLSLFAWVSAIPSPARSRSVPLYFQPLGSFGCWAAPCKVVCCALVCLARSIELTVPPRLFHMTAFFLCMENRIV